METSDRIAFAALVVSCVALVVAGFAAWFAMRQAHAAEEANRINAGPIWRIYGTSTRFKLINQSDRVQTGVTLDTSRIPCHCTKAPKDATISVGEAVAPEFTLMDAKGQQFPEHLYIRWDGMPKPKHWYTPWRDGWRAVAVERPTEPFAFYGP